MSRHVSPHGLPAGPVPVCPSAVPDQDFLHLVEAHGLTGSWTWTFATGEQCWSPGLFRLLGFEPGAVRPDYDLFLTFVHPEDRPAVESNAQVMRDGAFHDHTVRVIRPDGSLRVLANRGTVYFTRTGARAGWPRWCWT